MTTRLLDALAILEPVAGRAGRPRPAAPSRGADGHVRGAGAPGTARPTCRARSLTIACLLLAVALGAGQGRAAETLPEPGTATSLAGSWRLALDRADAGVVEGWFERSLADRIELPGSLPGQGLGDPVTLQTPWIGGIVDK